MIVIINLMKVKIIINKIQIYKKKNHKITLTIIKKKIIIYQSKMIKINKI